MRRVTQLVSSGFKSSRSTTQQHAGSDTGRYHHANVQTSAHLPQLAPPADFCRVKPNDHAQSQCKGCDVVCELLRWGESRKRQDPDFEGCSPRRVIHFSYCELKLCGSRKTGCDTCQTIHRGFLLDQITGQDADSLRDPNNQWPIHAMLTIGNSGDSLLFTIESPQTTLFTTTIHLQRPRKSSGHKKLSSSSTRSPPSTRSCPTAEPTTGASRLHPDFAELHSVVRDCLDYHECSSKHRWSDQNPTWLLEILPYNQVRLVEGKGTPVEYVVLSYSWGDPATMPAAEWARIKAARTMTTNGKPVPERLNGFDQRALPETMQDAIAISYDLGFRYIWIDSVCIPKGTDWDTEAALMHQVYGNAAFTLVACSSVKATDRLLCDRLAWTHRNVAHKLRGQFLHNSQMSLDEVRLGAPVSQRSWTLQEERLSPRILYWANQRWYWSCTERQTVEMGEFGIPSPPLPNEAWSLPHRYLEACRIGDEHQLHEEWLDIVEAYTRRDLVEAKDRFLAIAGLAVRFYNAKAEVGKGVVPEEYLAGLWKDDFARQLAWSVVKPAAPWQHLQHIAPSWSWASLPLLVHTKTKHSFRLSPHFEFVGTKFINPAETAVAITTPTTASTTDMEWAMTKIGDFSSNAREMGQFIERRGRNTKVVEVRGRFRKFVSANSQKVPWEHIQIKRDRREIFNFAPGCHVHSRNLNDGRVLAKDAHGGEIVGQLDYLAPPDSCNEVKRLGVYLPDGAEKDLYCLELGESAMLLLQANRRWGVADSYRRVGVCIGYENRRGFFYGCTAENILLA